MKEHLERDTEDTFPVRRCFEHKCFMKYTKYVHHTPKNIYFCTPLTFANTRLNFQLLYQSLTSMFHCIGNRALNFGSSV